ncbi:phosphoribosyltransferase [Spirochaetia bacterium 38H-sp]|uniref:Phosphoribosyltransferase n=1 Tax=Rarispira pelagica TaxID=3141764 RepID=A0ABU9U9K0_9SPIR
MEKAYYFTYEEIHNTVGKLAGKLKESGFCPDLIVAIGTGGFIPARILRTYIEKPILTVGIAYYDANNRPTDIPRKIQWIDEVEKKLTGKRILLVDEIDDTRATLAYCLSELDKNKPEELAVMVLHNKKKPKKADFPSCVSKIFVGSELEDYWVYYPWDATDIEEHNKLARK